MLGKVRAEITRIQGDVRASYRGRVHDWTNTLGSICMSRGFARSALAKYAPRHRVGQGLTVTVLKTGLNSV